MRSLAGLLAQQPAHMPDTYSFKELAPLLTKNNDTLYIVNFWATWCAPCVEELPAFEDLNSACAGQKVKVMLVSLDFKSKKESQLIPFLVKNNIKSKVLHLYEPDSDSWIGKVDPKWTGTIPATLLFKKNQRLFHEGKLSANELETLIQKFK